MIVAFPACSTISSCQSNGKLSRHRGSNPWPSSITFFAITPKSIVIKKKIIWRKGNVMYCGERDGYRKRVRERERERNKEREKEKEIKKEIKKERKRERERECFSQILVIICGQPWRGWIWNKKIKWQQILQKNFYGKNYLSNLWRQHDLTNLT